MPRTTDRRRTPRPLRWLVHVALVMLLLGVQQFAVAHAMAHATATPHDTDPGVPGHERCELCAALTPLGSGLTDAARTPPIAFSAPRAGARVVLPALKARAPSAYRSRAPPRA